MAETAREYLIHRFRGDAQALRERTAALKGGAKIPGPDAPTSGQMADACEAVVALLEALGPHDDAPREIAALLTLIPPLEARASASAALPPVRAVFAGAATRIREVEQAEARARTMAEADAVAETEDDADDPADDFDEDDDDLHADDGDADA